MSDKAIIRRDPGEARVDVQGLKPPGPVRVQHETPAGAIVTASRRTLRALTEGDRDVKLLPDTNLLRVYDHVIDVEAAEPLAGVSTRARVPRALAPDWRHHLVQLDGPPIPEWVAAIEGAGAEVVEPMGAYGLFVLADREAMAAVAALDFVAWAGPFQPAWRVAPSLAGLRGTVPVRIGVVPPGDAADVARAVEAAGGEVEGVVVPEPGAARPPGGGRYGTVTARVPAAAARAEIARHPSVRYVELHEPMQLDDERSVQIIAESTTGAGAAAVPATGYTARLTAAGIDGAGVTIAIADSGIDNHDNATLHADLRGRLAFFADQTAGAGVTDANGHGTHVAGIAAGDGTTGDTDPGGFVLGLGVAPGADVGSVNVLGIAQNFSFPDAIADAATNGSQVMNNSWGGQMDNEGYVAQAREVDSGVRDPDPATAVLERLTVVFSAGNRGGFARTITAPHECKNAIVVGNSLNGRPGELFPDDDIRGLSPSSSRGPAVDGRTVPTVVAPGTDIVAARSTIDADAATAGVQQNRPAYVDTGGTAHNQHTALTGTSMAAPHVSGLCALLVEWWRNRTGQDPSPALVKALLVNTAEDLAGGPNWRSLFVAWTPAAPNFTLAGSGFDPAQLAEVDAAGTWRLMNRVANVGAIAAVRDWAYTAATDTITVRTTGGAQPFGPTAPRVGISALDPTPLAAVPNSDQGWGRVSFDNLFHSAPDSDRGPRIVVDERLGFDAAGQTWTIRVAPVDTARPMRITLAWTDAPGAAGANPALVNDLDLTVREVATGTLFRGNVFANGFSTAGGAADTLNNVECVYVRNPAGAYEVTVTASALRADARPPFAATAPWQDFAIVLDNADPPDTPSARVAFALDRSGSMVVSDYVDVTRTAARGFLDLLAVDDEAGVASFADGAVDEFPATSPPSLRRIAGQADRDAAKAAVDAIGFGGSTDMGPGLQAAADMLPAGGTRNAVVLMSDGFDNGTPDARTVAGGLPAGVDVHTCAMGPLSDQELLEDLADATGGRYLFMPTIDDLFLLLNVVREQVTGTGLIVNEQHVASASRVGALVERSASRVTFLVNWADSGLGWVPRPPQGPQEISVRLRAPNGKLLIADEPTVRRRRGAGYVAFAIDDPLPGQWFVEVATARPDHTLYTVGGFVRSPIRIDVAIDPPGPVRRSPVEVRVDVWDGTRGVVDLTGRACVSAPRLSIRQPPPELAALLRGIRPVRTTGGDRIPDDLGELWALERRLAKQGRPLVDRRTVCRPLAPPPPGGGGTGGGVVVTIPGTGGGVVTVPVGGGGPGTVGVEAAAPAAASPALATLRRLAGAFPIRGLLAVAGPGPSRLVASVPGSAHPGSITATVTLEGTTYDGDRFARTTMRSARVR